MPLLAVLFVLIIVGIVLYLINNYIPMDGKIKKILNIVTIFIVIVWLLKVIGVFGYLGTVHI